MRVYYHTKKGLTRERNGAFPCQTVSVLPTIISLWDFNCEIILYLHRVNTITCQERRENHEIR